MIDEPLDDMLLELATAALDVLRSNFLRSRERVRDLERAINEVLDAEIGDDAVALRRILSDALE